jgi:hypothetical protein
MTRAGVSFSDHQIRMLRETAKSVPFDKRGDFMLAVARRLTGLPSDAAVTAAINWALDGINTERIP